VIQGTFVKKGAMDVNVWKGLVPADEVPYVVNPDKGFVVSANNMMASDKCPHGISHALVFYHRAARIHEILAEKTRDGKKVNVKDMHQMQFDLVDI
jgi:penicillin amidase